MSDQDDRVELQLLDDGVEVAGLVGGGVGVAGGLVGGAPAEEVEAHHPASGEFGDEAVIEVQVVGEAVHEHDGWLPAWVVAGVEVVGAAPDAVLAVAGRSRDGRLEAIRFHGHPPLRCSYTYLSCITS